MPKQSPLPNENHANCAHSHAIIAKNVRDPTRKIIVLNREETERAWNILKIQVETVKKSKRSKKRK